MEWGASQHHNIITVFIIQMQALCYMQLRQLDYVPQFKKT